MEMWTTYKESQTCNDWIEYKSVSNEAAKKSTRVCLTRRLRSTDRQRKNSRRNLSITLRILLSHFTPIIAELLSKFRSKSHTKDAVGSVNHT